jgi:serralysin
MALKGTNGNDRFRGTLFDDEMFGLGGEDFFSGSPGDDTMDGGSETDTVDYSQFVALLPFPTTVAGNAVDVDLERVLQIGGLANGDVLLDIENVGGSGEDDVIRGNAEANTLFGNGGDDTIEGRDGADTIQGDATFSFIVYGDDEGDDHLDGGGGNDVIFGNKGNDTLLGGADDDQLFGQDGNDTLTGGLDDDELSGGASNDTLFGDQGFDHLDGGAGTDTATYANSGAAVTVVLTPAGDGIGLFGDAAGDMLVSIENVTGSAFADSLFGSVGANTLSGGAGNDVLAGRAGADTLRGDSGFDTASYAASGSAVVVDLAAGIAAGGDAAGDTLISIENLTGSAFADFLFGNGFTNVLDGGGGADVLFGAGGNDVYIVDNAGDAVSESAGQGVADEVRTSVTYTLTAGAEVETLRTTNDAGTGAINLTGNAFANVVRGNNGANIINGGAGNDQLIGLGGQDSFLFNTALDNQNNVDVIADFAVADDTILLDNAVFGELALGKLPANQFVVGPVAQDANDRIVYNDVAGVLLFDGDGAGGSAAVLIAVLDPGLALSNLDFLIV